MANDFPTAPTIGDTVAFNNILYSWDGTKWNGSQNADLDTRFVQAAGDTMTGSLVPPTTGQSGYWSRSGTTLSPSDTGDSVDIGSSNIALNADGSIKATGKINSGDFTATGTTTAGVRLQDNGQVAIQKTAATASSSRAYRGFLGSVETFAVEGGGNILVGGDLTSTTAPSPNITLNANGRIAAVATSGALAHRFERDIAVQDSNSIIFFPIVGQTNSVARISASGKFGSRTGTSNNYEWLAGASLNNDNYEIRNRNGTGVKIIDGGNTWASLSDERSKTNLVNIEDGLNKVSTLRSVTGRYLTDEESVSRPFLIAQDVKAVLPGAVAEDSEGLNLFYEAVIPLLVSALKDAKDRIEELEARLDAADM